MSEGYEYVETFLQDPEKVKRARERQQEQTGDGVVGRFLKYQTNCM